jgi:hypothetical protein
MHSVESDQAAAFSRSNVNVDANLQSTRPSLPTKKCRRNDIFQTFQTKPSWRSGTPFRELSVNQFLAPEKAD